MTVGLAGAADDAGTTALPTSSSPPSVTDQQQRELERAIDALGSADPAARERANNRLWAAGPAAEPLLREAAASQALDPERARRAKGILRNFELGILPDTPPTLLALIDEYRRGPSDRRRAAAAELARQGARGLRVLTKLHWTERDGETRAVLRQTLARQARLHVATLLADADFDAAEQLLRAAVASADASEETLRDLAAFLAARGTLAAEIARLTASPADARRPTVPAASPPRTPRTLALFHRAAGDSKAAVAAAHESGDERLVDELLIEDADWAAMADRVARRHPAGIDALGYAAAFARLAGDETAAARWCDAIASAARPTDPPPPQSSDAADAAEALLLNGRPDDAVDVLRRNGRFDQAAVYLRARLRFDELRTLCGEAEKSADPTEAALAKARSADVLNFLGDPAGGRAALEAVAAATRGRPDLPRRRRAAPANPANGGGPTDAAAAAVVRAAAGMHDRALLDAHLVAELERVNPANRPAVVALFAAARGATTRLGGGFGDGATPARWWSFLRRRYREPEKLTLDRLRSILNNELPAAELEATARAAELDVGGNADDRGGWMNDVADALLAGGRRGAAKQLCGRLGFAGAAEFVVRLADLEAEDGRPSEAARLYGRAWEMDRTQPVPPLLRGLTLIELGHEREGRALVELAHVLPLADERRRQALFVALERRKRADDLRRERELTERTGLPGSWHRSDVLRRAGDAANAREDYAAAVRLWEQAFVINFRRDVAFVDPTANLSMPALLLRTRALAAIAAGDVRNGLALARRAMAQSPGDTDALIDVVNALDAAGRPTEAGGLYAEATSLYRRLCERHPNSSALHNQFAWAAAKCNRDPADAVAHAAAAAKLAPDDTAVLDTLAEAQFRNGDAAAAVETMKRCVELEPGVERHGEQLARFEAALPGGGSGGPN